jgi:hypothetical protein
VSDEEEDDAAVSGLSSIEFDAGAAAAAELERDECGRNCQRAQHEINRKEGVLRDKQRAILRELWMGAADCCRALLRGTGRPRSASVSPGWLLLLLCSPIWIISHPDASRAGSRRAGSSR